MSQDPQRQAGNYLSIYLCYTVFFVLIKQIKYMSDILISFQGGEKTLGIDRWVVPSYFLPLMLG